MKKLFGLLLVSIAWGQTTHAVRLTWVDNQNPAGSTYSVYRAVGLCSGSPQFSKIATAITTKAFEDTTVQTGNYCYQVTATVQGMESAPSNTALAPVPSFPPQGLQVVVR